MIIKNSPINFINFIDKITEKISLWDYLFDLQRQKPIILYGMGNGADKILNLCERKNIKITDIFASDEFVRGQVFRGYKVKNFSEIQETYSNFYIITAFATREDAVIERIRGLCELYELYCPNFPVFGEAYPDYDFFLENISDLEKAYNLLSDDISKEVYINAVNFAVSGKVEYLKNADCLKSDALDLLKLLNLCDNLHYIDVGAYNGDTILELADYLDNKNHKKNIGINKITAFEPDKKNFAKLEKNLRGQNLLGLCEIYNLGAWSEKNTLYFDAKSGRNSSFSNINLKKSIEICVNSLDNVLDLNKNSEILIKYDVEGAECEALNGSAEIIKEYAPKLIVSLYHRNEDIFKIPLLIHSINPNYNFYIRKHKYIPCWDLNLYAAPKFNSCPS